MKKFFIFGLIAFVGFGFMGPIYPRSVGYFESNYKIAKERYKECNDAEYRSKRSKKEEKDCENAYSALSKIEKPALEEFKHSYGAIKMYFYQFDKFDSDISNMITRGHYELQKYVGEKLKEKKIADDLSSVAIEQYNGTIKVKGKDCVKFVTKNELELEVLLNRNEEICSIVFDTMKPDTVLLDKNKRVVGKVIFK